MKFKRSLASSQNLQEVLQRASSFLAAAGVETHAAKWLLFEKYQRTSLDLALNRQMLSEEELQSYEADLAQLAQHYPAQYLAGHSWFYGRKFKVDERVLIPRPETEEWFALLLAEWGSEPVRACDIGTGSGVLAISLALERPQWQLTALDISQEALELARFNAQALQAEVDFVQSDLTQAVSQQEFDLIVSNPPYISPSEWAEMGESVRRYEPQLALFAEEGGLAVYRRLAQELPTCLAEEGQVYLEIGYRQGPAVQNIMQAAFPHKEVTIHPDGRGLDRLVKVH